jgi:hypothetical protein
LDLAGVGVDDFSEAPDDLRSEAFPGAVAVGLAFLVLDEVVDGYLESLTPRVSGRRGSSSATCR